MEQKELFLYNTGSRSKEKFVKSHDSVGMYCCGPTVYNFAHIGNLRTYIFEDVLKRTLRAAGYAVKHVMNITDVGHLTSDADTGEDKMEKGAVREGKSVWEIAGFYTGKFMDNVHDLNIIDPDLTPRATEHIPQMLALIKELEKRKFTYKTSDGIYFDTTKFTTYCDFARLDPESLRAGERVDMGEKRAVTDFALWKFSPKDTKRAMEWESPWGLGFPGWHIECSAMSLAYLPQPLDIHCGGQDHVRVHHTNEIAQSEAATGRQFAKYWCHGEFLVIDKGKMAKSGGNFITLDTVKREGVDPLSYRMFCFTAHYRSPLTFSWEGLGAAATFLANLRKAVPGDAPAQAEIHADRIGKAMVPFYGAVYDDMNMPRATAALWELLRDGALSGPDRREIARKAEEIVGLDLMRKEKATGEVVVTASGKKVKIYEHPRLSPEIREKIVIMVEARYHARAGKNFKESDRIRDELAGMGVALRDLPDGSTEIACT